MPSACITLPKNIDAEMLCVGADVKIKIKASKNHWKAKEHNPILTLKVNILFVFNTSVCILSLAITKITGTQTTIYINDEMI